MGATLNWLANRRIRDLIDMTMNWQSYLRTRTRQPEFLWRMVIWMLAAGIGVGYVAEKVYQPKHTEQRAERLDESKESWKELRELAREQHWWQLWWQMPRVIYQHPSAGAVTLAALAGVCWFVFLWQAMHAPSWQSLQFWTAVAAVPLGVLSIWPTMFLSYWFEYRWNFSEGLELIPGLRYFILSVGLREELSKLLCLLPLMPILLRLRNELTTLVVSGCVGLGFAFEENIGYFGRSGGTDSLGRFLTANPMHITLTGIAGLMLYRVFRNPSGWGAHGAGVIGVIIFAHGLYDAFIVLPALADYSLFGMIIFALMVYQFFRELRDMRKRRGETISLSATFLFGVCLLVSATFVYLSANVGISVAFNTLAQSVLGLAVMVYLFLREMPESMVTV